MECTYTVQSIIRDEIQSVATQSTSCVLAEINANFEMQDRKINNIIAKLDRNFEHLQLPTVLHFIKIKVRLKTVMS